MPLASRQAACKASQLLHGHLVPEAQVEQRALCPGRRRQARWPAGRRRCGREVSEGLRHRLPHGRGQAGRSTSHRKRPVFGPKHAVLAHFQAQLRAFRSSLSPCDVGAFRAQRLGSSKGWPSFSSSSSKSNMAQKLVASCLRSLSALSSHETPPELISRPHGALCRGTQGG